MSESGYPQARRLELTEQILGHQVSDPYRWLEDDTGAERAGWLRAQAGLFATPGGVARPGRVRRAGGPVLLRAEGQVGHGARAVSRTAELAGDTLAFAAYHTGLRVCGITGTAEASS